MTLYEVKVTRPAFMDLQEIGDYVAKNLQMPDEAERLIGEISEAVLGLERFPERSPVIADEDLQEKGIHWIRVRNYLIFYVIDEEILVVHILRVLYERRNWKHLLLYPIQIYE